VVVDTLDEMFDVTAVVARYPVPAVAGAGVITNSGAIKGLALDFSEPLDLPLPQVGEAAATALAALPGVSEVTNPLDLGAAGFADPSVFGTSAEAMLTDPAIGMALLAHAGGSAPMQRIKGDAILPIATRSEKPVLL